MKKLQKEQLKKSEKNWKNWKNGFILCARDHPPCADCFFPRNITDVETAQKIATDTAWAWFDYKLDETVVYFRAMRVLSAIATLCVAFLITYLPYIEQFAITLNQVCAVLLCFGYFLSLASCLLAISIYARFPSICRLRNVIHLNLITTYVISAVGYLIAFFLQTKLQSHAQEDLILEITVLYEGHSEIIDTPLAF